MRRRRDQDGPGRVFHVAARVNWRTFLFGSDPRKDRILEVLRAACESFGVEILGYVVMSNHFHAILRCPARRLFNTLTSRVTSCRHRRAWPPGHQNGSVLSQCMRRFMNSVSRTVHEEIGVTGRLWEESYFARRVKDGEDLATVLAYIHLNPVKQGLVEVSEEYAWSSAPHWSHARGRIWAEHGYEELPFGLDRGDLALQLASMTTNGELLAAMRDLEREGVDATAPGTYELIAEKLAEVRRTLRAARAAPEPPDDTTTPWA